MKVKAPKEDPAAKAARAREERRADSQFIENASNLLGEEERRRVRRFGRRTGAVQVSGGASGRRGLSGVAGVLYQMAGGSVPSGGGGGGSFDPGAYGGSSGFTSSSGSER